MSVACRSVSSLLRLEPLGLEPWRHITQWSKERKAQVVFRRLGFA